MHSNGPGLSADDFLQFLESAPDAIFVQRAGVITFANAAFARAMRAAGPEALVRREVVRDLVAPEERARIAALLRDPDPRATRAPSDARCVRDDGTLVTFEFSSVRVGDPQNPASVIICRDVTAQRAQAADLSRAEAELRLVFEGAPIGVTLTSLQGNYLRANRAMCELVGYSEDELRQRTFVELTHPDDRALDKEVVQKLLDGTVRACSLSKRYLAATAPPSTSRSTSGWCARKTARPSASSPTSST